ncbi:hypothetical protein ABZ321_46250, partial [Dactylosporangium sp. NPDC006015]
MTIGIRDRIRHALLFAGGLAFALAASLVVGAGAARAAPSPPAPDQVPPALAAVTCGYNGAENKWMPRSMAVTRARSWIGKTPYSQTRCYRNSYGDYRTDCSGMVAMAWGLGGQGSDWWTGNLDDVSTPIPASQLAAGDALLYHDGTSNGSHVALFVSWKDSAHTQPIVVQENGSTDNTIEGVPTNFNWRNYTPVRYDRIVEDQPPAVSRPRPGSGLVRWGDQLQGFERRADNTLQH